jgi:hypothetical protein
MKRDCPLHKGEVDMTFKDIIFPGICFCFLFSTTVPAEVIPLNQDRTISCSSIASDGEVNLIYEDSASAPDFDLFNETVSVTSYIGSAYAHGAAHQTSVIEPTAFFAYGGCDAKGEGYEGWGYGDGHGRTFFQCEFEINTPTLFALTGYLESYEEGSTILSLTGSGISLNLAAGYNNHFDFNESGDLTPGIYIFTVLASSSAYGDITSFGHAFGGFEVEMVFTSTSASPFSGRDDLTLRLSPNPFSQKTEIAFSVPVQRISSLEIFDLRGHLVRSLVTGGRESGSLSWDGRNSRGQAAATGTYLILLRSGDEVWRQKAILVR